MKLHRGAKKLYEFLQGTKTGQIVPRKQFLAAMGWKESTLKTYITKNMLTPFLIQDTASQFRIVKDGSTVTPDEVTAAFSQVKPASLQLAKGDELVGKGHKYRLLRFLGNGAVAHVWEAIRLTDKATVAAKIVNPRPDLLKPSVYSNVKRRFRREAQNGQTFTHPSVVDITDHGDFRNHPFLVMSLATDSVGAVLKTGVTFSESESRQLMLKVISALVYIHAEKCIHRDIKPDNILRYGSDYVVGDLGIVKWSDLNPAFVSAGTITKESVQLGSWFYMAPEQRSNPKSVGTACDIYAAGVTWYELLTGSHGEPAAFAAGQFPDPSNHAPTNSLIRSMLVFDPAMRPSAAAVLSAINSWP